MAVVRLSLHIFTRKRCSRAHSPLHTALYTLRRYITIVLAVRRSHRLSLAHSRQFLFSTHSSPHTRDASATVHTTLSRCPTSCKRPHARPDRSVTSKEEDLIRCPPHTKNSLVAHDIELYCSWLSERNESTCETYTSKLLPGRITTPVRAVPSTTISSGASVWMCRTYCVP